MQDMLSFFAEKQNFAAKVSFWKTGEAWEKDMVIHNAQNQNGVEKGRG